MIQKQVPRTTEDISSYGVCSLRDEVKTTAGGNLEAQVGGPGFQTKPFPVSWVYASRWERERLGIGEMEDLARIDGSAQQNTTMPHAL